LAADVTRRSPEPGTLLAFDFGTRRIGVAIGNRLLRVARALTTIDAEANAVRFSAIAALVEEWRPERLVVGRPVHMDGTGHAMTVRAERFARQLEGRFAIPVTAVDERLTTQEAKSLLAAYGRGADRGARDAVAAELVLQAYFDGLPSGEGG
jgi:putative Holliday junction resolvase